MPERHVIVDTETTGLSPRAKDGELPDRIVEIGAVEMVDFVETGRTFHCYVNPMRDVPEEAFKVHGLSAEFLADKPVFSEVADSFLEFLGDATFTAHNAPFDFGFLNAELEACGKPPLRNEILDTVALARNRFPSARATLDALCDRFGIDRTGREVHGALKDCLLLAQVLIPLTGRDTFLHGHVESSARAGSDSPFMPDSARQAWFPARPPVEPSEAESTAHAALLGALKDPIWVKNGLIAP
jgi:DNA polymerase III, epsilon subunit, Proteobacterial